jgi:hypothetical protein
MHVQHLEKSLSFESSSLVRFLLFMYSFRTVISFPRSPVLYSYAIFRPLASPLLLPFSLSST